MMNSPKSNYAERMNNRRGYGDGSDLTRIEKTAVYGQVGILIISYALGALYTVLFVALLLGRSRLAEALANFSVGSMVVTNHIATVLLIPAVILAFIRPVRPLGGVGLVLIGRLGLFMAMCVSATFAYNTLGAVGLIAGTLLAGAGVIPVAFVGLLFRGDWVGMATWVLPVVSSLFFLIVGQLVLNKSLPQGAILKRREL